MVVLAAVLMTLGYIVFMPVTLYLRAEWDMRSGLYIGLRLLFADMRRGLEHEVYSSVSPEQKRFRMNVDHLRMIIETVHRLLSRRLLSGRLRVLLNAGDAAATALLFGALCAAGGMFRIRVRADVRYDGEPFLHLRGMIRARTGHIAFAVLSGIARTKRGRLTQWIENRSRAL